MTQTQVPGPGMTRSATLRAADLPAEFNLGTYFIDRNEPGRTAVVTDAGPTTYGELTTLTNQVGRALRSVGVRRGDRVMIALNDSIEFVTTWFGAQKIGAVTTEVYSFLPEKDLRYFADYIEPAVVVTDAATVHRIRGAGITGAIVVGLPATELLPDERDFRTLVERQPTELDAVPLTENDVALWKFTTGSTGSPKATVLAARSPMLSFHWLGRGVLDMGPDDIVLPVPKLFFGYARDLAAMFPFGVGGSAVLFPERSTPDRIFDLIAEHRPTILVNVPTMMSAMVAHPRAVSADLSCVRLNISAGEALPAELYRKWMDRFGVDIVDTIGSAEVYHGYLANRPGRGRPGSLGQVVPGYQVSVVDERRHPVPNGTPGVLEVVGETVALGYWKAAGKTAETFPAPHTTITGDLFTRDADGYFYYQGRADDLLKVGGVWVSPIEVENCLTGHPRVVEAALAAVEVDGLTRSRAYVVVNGTVSAEELQRYVKERLSPHKYPRQVRFVDELPKTPNGKLDRRALRKW